MQDIGGNFWQVPGSEKKPGGQVTLPTLFKSRQM